MHGRDVRRGGQMLHEIGRLILEQGLIRKVHAGTPLYRVRTSAVGKTYASAGDLDRPSRASPAEPDEPGRGSRCSTRLRARHRRDRGRRPDDDVATIGRFEPVEDLCVVDLHDLPEVPSLFDEARRDSRAPIGFLRGFAEAEPAGRARRRRARRVRADADRDRVPALRLPRLRGRPGRRVGLRVAQTQGGRCIVLFADRDGCLEKDDDPRDRGISLRLTDVQLRSPL